MLVKGNQWAACGQALAERTAACFVCMMEAEAPALCSSEFPVLTVESFQKGLGCSYLVWLGLS